MKVRHTPAGLREAGVPVDLVSVPGAAVGLAVFAGIWALKESINDIVRAFVMRPRAS